MPASTLGTTILFVRSGTPNPPTTGPTTGVAATGYCKVAPTGASYCEDFSTYDDTADFVETTVAAPAGSQQKWDNGATLQ
jgi:hypothetical protein